MVREVPEIQANTCSMKMFSFGLAVIPLERNGVGAHVYLVLLKWSRNSQSLSNVE